VDKTSPLRMMGVQAFEGGQHRIGGPESRDVSLGWKARRQRPLVCAEVGLHTDLARLDALAYPDETDQLSDPKSITCPKRNISAVVV